MTEIIFNDLHVPNHDRRALNILLKVIHEVRPDIVTCLGDLVDCYTISRFNKDPNRKLTLGHEIIMARNILHEIAETTFQVAEDYKTRLIFHGGNHEDRLRKYVWGRCPDLASLPELSWPTLLHLSRDGWEYVPYETPFKIGGLWHHHGDVIRQRSGYTARALLDKIGDNAICGHTHRLAHIHRTTWSSHIQGWENGCLCKLKADYITGTPDWQQGFSIVEYGARKSFKVQQVHIHKGKAWVNGEQICA